MSQSRTVGPRGGGRLTGIGAFLVAGMIGSLAPGQAPAPAPNQVSDLSTRYRFIERYAPAVTHAPAQPGEIGQYRVAIRDVLKVVSETEQGTPDRKETTVQVISTERPVTVSSLGAVTALIRRYDAYRVTPQPTVKPSATATKPLEGLTLWLQSPPKTNSRPLLISLTDNRALTETEYVISSQRLAYLPDLAGLLPVLPMRVGDRWPISPAAMQALLGDRPLPKGGSLVGELLDVRKSADKPEMVAEIRLTGRVLMPPNGSDTLVNAMLNFKFPTQAGAPGPPPSPASTGNGTTVDARGAITDLRLARSSISAVPGGNGRLRRTFTGELTLQRDLTRPGDPLPIPARTPVATSANSWVTYHDPLGRFQFRHPQELHPENQPEAIELGFVTLADDRAGTHDGRVVTINLQSKTGNPNDDLKNNDPEVHKKEQYQVWAEAEDRKDVLSGPSGWLPEADWGRYHMKVYRFEAALRSAGAAYKDTPRLFLDDYLVLFSQNESVVLQSMTGQDPPTPFRKQVEEILRTLVVNPTPKPAR